jgi:hypothetical protein
MQELIDVITAAIATDASSEQKTAGVQACRTIATALDTEPGKPLTLPNSVSAPPTSRISLDQVLDLVIARLNVVATERERTHVPADPTAMPPPVSQSPPRGLQIPLAPTNALNRASRSATQRGVPRSALRPARAPRSQPMRRK